MIIRQVFAPAFAVAALLSCAPASAALVNFYNYFAPYTGHFDYWSRCSDKKLEPEQRIHYCRSMLGTGRGDDAAAWTEIGSAYLEERKYDLAIAAFKSALNFDNATFEPREKLDEALALTGHYQDAVTDLEQVAGDYHTRANGNGALCWVRAIEGKDLDLALANCNKALDDEPDNADILDSRGLVEFKLGKLKEAAADYRAALGHTPRLESSLYMRGIIELRSGDSADGNADIAAAKGRDPFIADEYAAYGVSS